MEEFRCPLGLSNEDAICPMCSNAKPLMVGHFTYDGPRLQHGFRLMFVDGGWSSIIKNPDGETKSTYEKIVKGRGACTEWFKKRITVACGCGGEIKCECGYLTGFCFPSKEQPTCIFCGRECERTFYDTRVHSYEDFFND